jgi:hypothetical protein
MRMKTGNFVDGWILRPKLPLNIEAQRETWKHKRRVDQNIMQRMLRHYLDGSKERKDS